jgi:5-methylcytosine-specific restriction endonuclease McrA
MIQTKTCTTCNQEKSTTEFHKNKLGKFGVGSTCKSCIKQYRQNNQESIAKQRKQYHQDNKEHIAARMKQYQADNKSHIAEYKKQYKQTNAEKIAARAKQYYRDNKGYIAEQTKQYKQENAGHIAEYKKRYAKTPKGKAVAKARSHNRRAHKLNNGGKHTGAQILALFDLQSGVCPYCKTKLHKSGKNIFHADHIVPLSKGGTNDISNIQLLCPSCNMSKHDKLPEEFAAKFGKLF